MPNLSLRKLWRKRSVTISEKDPNYKVIYLGNVLTGWAKGEGCVDKPLATLWRSYCQSTRSEIVMKITICSSGLQAVTREHGLTEYWAHRVTYCGAHPGYPKVFCWVYRHEGRRLKQELRCHAVLCHRSDKALVMAGQLKERLTQALHEFRREKVIRQNARLSLMHAIYDNASLPTRKVLLSTGSANYRPPLERSKSAPKLGSIEETIEEDEEEDDSPIEQIGCIVLSKHFQCSPVGSIAISETTSDIVHYNTSSSELSAAFLFSRSASQKSDKHISGDEEEEEEAEGGQQQRRQELLPNSSTATATSGGEELVHHPSSQLPNSRSCNTPSSNLNSVSNCSSTSSSSNSCSNNSNNNNGSAYVYSSRKIAPSLKPPVVQRRFIRSISVDTSLDCDDNDDFDDHETQLLTNTSKEFRLSCRNSLGSNNQFVMSSNTEDSLADSGGEGVSLASTDTADTVLDRPYTTDSRAPSTDSVLDRPPTTDDTVLARPCTTEDTISLLNSLSHSLNRQMSLPQDTTPLAEESLTSDQPESLGSCNSSCGGGCSDGDGNCVVTSIRTTNASLDDDIATRHHHHHMAVGAGGVIPKTDRLLDLVSVSGQNMDNLGDLNSLGTEEPDNISEESGYAEEKDFLQSVELAKALNA